MDYYSTVSPPVFQNKTEEVKAFPRSLQFFFLPFFISQSLWPFCPVAQLAGIETGSSSDCVCEPR